MRISLATVEIQNQWDFFVNNHPDSHPFYFWEYGSLLKKIFNFEPERYFLNDNGQIKGVFPLFNKGRGRGLVSIPFADYGGPLAFNRKDSSAFDAILLQEKFSITSQDRNFLAPEIKNETSSYFVLDTKTDFATLLGSIVSQKTRNMVNKSDRSNLTLSQELSEKNLSEYYNLYLLTMKRLNRLPLPYIFINELVKIFPDKTRGFFCFHEGIMLAGILAFVTGKKMYIWGNASNREATALAANYAAYASAIRYACDNQNIELVNFGNSEKNSGHAFFKKRWGCSEKKLYLISSFRYENQGARREKIIHYINRLPRSLNQKLVKYIFRNY